MSVNFTGSGLSLESVAQTGPTTIVVRMTYDPLQTNPAGAHDALNPTLWTLVGPGISGAGVVGCGTVFGDPQSIFLFTSGTLAAGVWTVTASAAIQTSSGSAMSPPRFLSFTASPFATLPPVNPGAEDDTSENILRKHFNPALVGPAWDAILAGIAVGEDYNTEQSELAFDQLHKVSASGFYLDRLAGDDGLQRPAGVGMPDDLFSQYSIRTTNNQLTEGALLDVLEVFYGADALRAHFDSLPEIFALHDQDDLTILFDETLTVTVTFGASEFGTIGLSRASEVAASITRAARLSGSSAFAVAVTDPTTGLVRVRVYSGTIGLGSSVRVLGGKAQTVLQFPTLLGVFSGLPTWTLTYTAATATTRFTPNGSIDLSRVLVGDYLTVYGGQFNAANRGSYVVSNVSWSFPGGVLTQYVEVVNLFGVAQAGVVQVAATDLMFFRPTRASTHDVPARSVIVSSLPTEVDLVLPATSQSVGRGPNTAAYPPSQISTAITSIVRDVAGTCTVSSTGHGLTVGEHVIIAGVVPTLTPPTVTAGNGTTTSSFAATSVASGFSAPGGSNPARHWGSIATLNDGRVLFIGGSVAAGGTAVTAVDLWTITGSTPHAPNGTQYTLTRVADAVLASARSFCDAVVLTDPSALGKVLVAGGSTAGDAGGIGTINTTSVLYTPGAIGSGGSWGSASTMTSGRTALTLCQRSDGKVMAVGGCASGGGSWATVETYTPSTNAWANVVGLSIGRCQPGVIQLKTTDVLCAGGRTGVQTRLAYGTLADLLGITNTCELYNVIGNFWTIVGRMTYARVGHEMFVLDDGRVIAIGGVGFDPTQSATPAVLNTTEIYDPNTKEWLPGPSMRVARGYFASGRIGNSIYATGGAVGDTSAEYLDLTSMKWVGSPASTSTPVTKTAGTVTNGLLFVGYGVNVAADTNAFFVTPGSNSWMGGDLNDTQRVASVVDANTFTFASTIALYTAATGGTATGLTAPASTVLGPHVYDVAAGVSYTGSKSTTGQALAGGGQYASLVVDDATQFPDAPGWIVFHFGYADQVGPVKYLGRLSNTALALDYTYVFPRAVASGTSVNLLATNGSYVPTAPETEGSFYLTASPAGRVAAAAAAMAIGAAGVPMSISVTYPGDRGLGGEGLPTRGAQRLSDVVVVWGSDSVDADVAAARSS